MTIQAIVAQTEEERVAGIWTISSRTFDARAVAEIRFGPRDMSYALLGYELFQSPHPLLKTYQTKKLLLMLPRSVENDLRQAVYQLAHEVVHMLAPDGVGRPTVLEEGLATLFAQQYFEAAYPGYSMHPPIKSYEDARDAVARFMVSDEVIRKMRGEEPTFSKISPELLQRVNPNCTGEQAAYLCSSFRR